MTASSPGEALMRTPKYAAARAGASSTTAAPGSSTRARDIATADLMERNKTLVKEVRFADQTCVELSERMASLKAEADRLMSSLEWSEGECAGLRAELLAAGWRWARMEQRQDLAEERMEQVSAEEERRLGGAEAKLAEA